MFKYLNKRQDDNESNSRQFVVDCLIVVLLIFTDVEYQCHVTQVEVIAMYDYKLYQISVSCIFFWLFKYNICYMHIIYADNDPDSCKSVID